MFISQLGKTPLHIAAKQSDDYTCWLLLKCGAYVKAVDKVSYSMSFT